MSFNKKGIIFLKHFVRIKIVFTFATLSANKVSRHANKGTITTGNERGFTSPIKTIKPDTK